MKSPSPTEPSTPPAPRSLVRRVVLLIACVGAGGAIGFIGQSLTGKAEWFLAVPACIAIGWLFVANPDECVAREGSSRRAADRK